MNRDNLIYYFLIWKQYVFFSDPIAWASSAIISYISAYNTCLVPDCRWDTSGCGYRQLVGCVPGIQEALASAPSTTWTGYGGAYMYVCYLAISTKLQMAFHIGLKNFNTVCNQKAHMVKTLLGKRAKDRSTNTP